MSVEKALAIAVLAVFTTILLVACNAVGAALVTYGGTIGLIAMPFVLLLIAYLTFKMWQIAMRKLFPTKKEIK